MALVGQRGANCRAEVVAGLEGAPVGRALGAVAGDPVGHLGVGGEARRDEEDHGTIGRGSGEGVAALAATGAAGYQQYPPAHSMVTGSASMVQPGWRTRP